MGAFRVERPLASRARQPTAAAARISPAPAILATTRARATMTSPATFVSVIAAIHTVQSCTRHRPPRSIDHRSSLSTLIAGVWQPGVSPVTHTLVQVCVHLTYYCQLAGVVPSTRCTDDGHLHRRCAAVYHVCCCRGCTGDAGLLVCAASRHDSRRLWYARTVVRIPRYTLDQIVPQIVL